MVIKVCGIKTLENIQLMQEQSVDMVGLNFYPPSVRYIPQEYDAGLFDILSNKIKRVGVFVNESLEKIDALSENFKLDYIQLHGDESIETCKAIASRHKVIKVFRVGKSMNWNHVQEYDFVNMYLFDTATVAYGGSGKKFDWTVLNKYKGAVPFLLSGGIGPHDISRIIEIDHPKFWGIDINSKFEKERGIKDESLITDFLDNLKSKNL